MRIAPVILILFFLCRVGVYAESQPPSPTQSKTVKKQEHYSSQKNHNSQITNQVGSTISNHPKAFETEGKYKDYSSSEWWLVYLTFALVVVTLGLAIYTAKLYRATVGLGKDAKNTSERQAAEMAASIAEATKSAAAMERVASHMEISAKASTESVTALKERTAQQMRAYLAVTINNGVFQERAKDLKFDVRPTLSNSGNTPAHKITYWANADILPFPLPKDFKFPSTKKPIQSSFVLGPHQNVVLNAVVDDFVPDEEVVSIKLGKERRACIWGKVSYVDVFGVNHYTKFCHSIYWLGEEGKEMIFGNYDSNHNEAD